MAIETFDRAGFETVLPTDKTTGAALWTHTGIHDGEHCYRVRILGKGYDLWIRSSIRADGQSADVAEDSIRGYIVRKDGGPRDVVGNKAVRWVDRRKGWQGRTLAMLRQLARLVVAVKPCRDCGADLTPYTVKKKGPNKGRGFLKCEDKACPGHGRLQWVYDPDRPAGPDNTPPATSSPAPTSDLAPPCPKCGAGMVRMVKAAGWRCGVAGNRWDGKGWSVCDGTHWDSVKPPISVPADVRPAPKPIAAERAANAIVGRGDLSATFRLTGAVRKLAAELGDRNPVAAAVLADLRAAGLLAV